MRCIPFVFLALTACGVGEAARTPRTGADSVARAVAATSPDTARESTAPASLTDLLSDTTPVHGIYVNRFAAQSPRRMRQLIAVADSTEINAFVIDVKDEFGLNFDSPDTLVSRNKGRGGTIPHLEALLDTLHAHHIMPIARIVVFKDSVAARLNPDHVIRQPDGTPWRDKKGLTWVDPYDHRIWEYNIRVAEEMARLGFTEIQFDYIRFPEPYKSLPPQVFRDAGSTTKPQALAAFFRAACPRIHAAGARCTADIFGLVTTVNGALEVGQEWEALSPVTDVLLPMVYPSHYPHGAFGVAHPNAEPYRIIVTAIRRARERDEKLGITSRTHVRPWLQAFTLGQPHYGPHEIAEQKRAVYDAGYMSWTLWNPGSKYESW
ncbi:MAG TPA: putative glycoside hydrolase [Gemmatimonadaceae bacterium]|jgi:hypothetical protein